ncbi:MAG: hypothetical protein Q7J35_14205 [Candidatus Methanoperedens sp.]|nr:hypothetical protein [Candidatus Methanoperedens sp.]
MKEFKLSTAFLLLVWGMVLGALLVMALTTNDISTIPEITEKVTASLEGL